MNYGKIILDLCGGTGAWSAPYSEAEYHVIIVDPAEDLDHTGAPEHVKQDVRLYIPPPDVYGILFAPVCTHFSGSGAQYWPEKDADGRTLEALSLVDAGLRIILVSKPHFWCMENPVGRLRNWIGGPVMYFDPCEYGDPYTKKTCLWGNFNTHLERNPVEPVRVSPQGSWIMSLGGKSARTKRLRSITPPGFAQAFFEANP